MTSYFSNLVVFLLGTIAALLQEIINIYPAINPPVLTALQVNIKYSKHLNSYIIYSWDPNTGLVQYLNGLFWLEPGIW
jgi:hypothetical protein